MENQEITVEQNSEDASVKSASPTSTNGFVYVEDNISNCSSKSENIIKVNYPDTKNTITDDMPTLENCGEDVPKLVHEAQMDCFVLDHYTDEFDGKKESPIQSNDELLINSPFSSGEHSNTSDEEHSSSPKNSEDASDASVSFHSVTYLGACKIDAPVSELELKRSISILRENKDATISVILSVSLSPTGSIKLADPESRSVIASYNISNICYWGKGDPSTEEKDCLAFNISQGKDEIMYQCHVFQCSGDDDVTGIIQSLAQTIRKDQKRKQSEFPGVRRGSTLDPNNLTFKFNLTVDVWEEDGKGSYQQVARDRNHFKLRVQLQRKLVVIIHQTTNRKLKIEKCFGLLLALGRDVKDEDFHLLQHISMERRPHGTQISSHWDPNLEFWKLLNTDLKKDNKVYMTVAADIIFKDVKEPVRFIKETKVRVFPNNEKFWNPVKPDIQEEFTLKLKENFSELGEKWFEKESLNSASDLAKLKALKQPSHSLWRNGRHNNNKPVLDTTESVEAEEIMGPEELNYPNIVDEVEDDEPLVSGSGEIQRSYSDSEMHNWDDILQKWKDVERRPNKLLQSVRKGIPDSLRGQVWQMLCGIDDYADAELEKSYGVLCNKISQYEQVIFWDVARTFPGHEYFREMNGEGQQLLLKISTAYSNYDEDVGYCQGLSFIIAAFLLYVPAEQAYCLLVKLMYNYGLRELFLNGFKNLHQYFYVLDRILEDNIPDLYHHFRNNSIEVHMFASQWFLTLFTARFPLSLVYNIIDIVLCEGLDTVFQIAAALLKHTKKDLLALNFEGILNYFRIKLPKNYLDATHRKELLKMIYEIKISKKKVEKYKQEYVQMKEEEELKIEPVVRLERENQRLMQENLRLERENDSLAYEVVTTQVSMQEIVTDREEKLNNMTKEQENTKKQLIEAEEEAERLKQEEERVKNMWRTSIEEADTQKEVQERIIESYKEILSGMEARHEKKKNEFLAETELLKKQVASCENCATALLKNIYPDIEGDPIESASNDDGENSEITPVKVTRLLSKEDHEEQMRNLEEELIKTKVALAEEKNRADEIELKLHSLMSASEKPWYKKVVNNKK